MKQISTKALIAVVLWTIQIGAHAQSSDQVTTLRVANNGVNNLSCGSAARPCRSISRAILNANEGDLILVGPGIYDAFVESGDNTGCLGIACIVHVDKRVTIRSTHGAAETVVHGRINDTSTGIPVFIAASGVVFGAPGHGFTLTGSLDHNGLAVFGDTTGVTVAGNTASVNAGGFSVFGVAHTVEQNIAVTINGGGFDINGFNHVVRNNSAAVSGDGFSLSGSGHVLTGNASSGNIFGFTILRGNGHLLEGNSAIGNSGAGFRLFPLTTATIRFSNIFGNGDRNSPSQNNCGVLNQSGQQIIARNNYWGARTGPGVQPSDNVGSGSGCDLGVGSLTAFKPFATQPVPVPPLSCALAGAWASLKGRQPSASGHMRERRWN